MTKARRLAKGDAFVVITNDDPKFLGIKDGGVGINEALERGKACLGCRRRKMRCDGKRPICSPCSRRNRQDDCEYTNDPNSGLTRMQMLENDVSRLQNRVRELEGSNPAQSRSKEPPPSSQSVPDLIPDRSSMALTDDPAMPTPLTTSSIFTPKRETSAELSPQTPTIDPDPEPQWWEREHPPDDISNMLICLFLPNSTQLGFALNNARFLQALTEEPTSPNYPHQGLMNAIYVWALRLSNKSNLLRHEAVYLQRAKAALMNGGMSFEDSVNPMRVVHTIQAQILVAQYLYCRECLGEGRYHNNSAVSLAVAYGFNRLYPSFGYGDQSPQSPTIQSHCLPPPQSWVEFGERLNVFWSAFNIDRCWMVLGSECIIPDDPLRGGHEIDSPWPLDMTDYESADLNREVLYFSRAGKTVQRFLAGETPQPGELGTSSTALRAKSSAVFGRAQHLRAWSQGQEPNPLPYSLENAMLSLKAVASQYADTLPKPEDLEQLYNSSDVRRTIFNAHAVAYTTVIIINSSGAYNGDDACIDACLNAGHECSRGPELTLTDLNLLDPMLFHTGIEMAKLYQTLLHQFRTVKSEDYQKEATRMRFLTMLTERLRRAQHRGEQCPVYGMHLTDISDVLGSMHL